MVASQFSDTTSRVISGATLFFGGVLLGACLVLIPASPAPTPAPTPTTNKIIEVERYRVVNYRGKAYTICTNGGVTDIQRLYEQITSDIWNPSPIYQITREDMAYIKVNE